MKIVFTLTELGMLAYWIFASVVAVGWLSVAPELMYSDYENPIIVIWNWSFLPIDVLFSITGLAARFGRMQPQNAEILRVVSLSMMFCAGLMAISFWSLQGWFDVTWWGLNIWLMGLSMFGLMRALAARSVRKTI